MKENEKRQTGIVMDNAEIRKLILENPDLPLVFRANEDAKVANWQLSGMYLSEFKEFVE